MKSSALMPNPHPDPGVDTESHSPGLLVELLALNEEMAEQLCLERLADLGQAEILTGLIAQHEKTAQLLRAQLAMFAQKRDSSLGGYNKAGKKRSSFWLGCA